MATKTIKTPSKIQFAADVDMAPGKSTGERRVFSMVAYSGDMVTQGGTDLPFVLDLSSTEVDRPKLPMLLGHDRGRIAGQAENIEIGDDIRLSGFITESSDAGKEVLALSADGFEWQASIFAVPGASDFYDEGEEVEVNNRKFSGPIVVLKSNKILETSFVAVGADRSTHVAVLSHGETKITLPDKEPEVMSAATLSELKAKFGDNSAFILSAMEKELTIEAAEKAFTEAENKRLGSENEELAQRLKALEDKYEEQKKLMDEAEEKKKEMEGNDPVGKDEDKKEMSLSAGEEFAAKMREITESNDSADRKRSRLSTLVATHPEGHAACLAAENGEDFYSDYVAAAQRRGRRR